MNQLNFKLKLMTFSPAICLTAELRLIMCFKYKTLHSFSGLWHWPEIHPLQLYSLQGANQLSSQLGRKLVSTSLCNFNNYNLYQLCNSSHRDLPKWLDYCVACRGRLNVFFLQKVVNFSVMKCFINGTSSSHLLGSYMLEQQDM